MNKVLIVIDVQNDFIDGALRNEEAIKRVPNIIEEIKNTDAKYIILTRDTHYRNYLNTMEGKKLPVPHCIIDTEGWQIKSEVMEAVKNSKILYSIYDKNTFGYDKWLSAFLDLRHIYNLYEQSSDLEIEVIGYCTDICVISNVLNIKSILPNATIEVKESCCAGITEQSHNNALEAMKMCHIEVI